MYHIIEYTTSLSPNTFNLSSLSFVMNSHVSPLNLWSL